MFRAVLIGGVLAASFACSEATEAPRVTIDVVVDETPFAPFTTNLGYDVTLDSVTLAFSDIQFTIAGELHAAAPWRALSRLLTSEARAHPGHYQGGEVTGELVGSWVAAWPATAASQLGTATLIAGDYSGANFRFDAAAAMRPDDDPPADHVLVVEGEVMRGEFTAPFTVTVDAPPGRSLDGAPFDARVSTGTSGPIVFSFAPVEPQSQGSFLDDVEFAELSVEAGNEIRIGPPDDGSGEQPGADAAYDRIRRALLSHDHYLFTLMEDR